MKINKTKKEFWDSEECEYCEGPIIAKEVEVCRKFGKKYAVIQHVPAGVCRSCGTRYFSANILKSIQNISEGQSKPRRELEVPVYSL